MKLLKNPITSIAPALRVHIWGGFGSQLFAGHFILRLRKKFPERKIIAIVHTSGITRRTLEFDFAKLGIESFQLEDFYKNINSQTSEPSRLRFSMALIMRAVRSKVKLFLIKTRIVVESNHEEEFLSVKPWTLATRGHYTNLNIEVELAQIIFDTLFPSIDKTRIAPEIAVHYRLGDLLSLEKKTPVPVDRVECIIKKLTVGNDAVLVMTDSAPDEFRVFASASSKLSTLTPINLDPMDTLGNCIFALQFLGTTAKLSIWAAIFRQYILKKKSYLPTELSWVKKIGLDCYWY